MIASECYEYCCGSNTHMLDYRQFPWRRGLCTRPACVGNPTTDVMPCFTCGSLICRIHDGDCDPCLKCGWPTCLRCLHVEHRARCPQRICRSTIERELSLWMNLRPPQVSQGSLNRLPRHQVWEGLSCRFCNALRNIGLAPVCASCLGPQCTDPRCLCELRTPFCQCFGGEDICHACGRFDAAGQNFRCNLCNESDARDAALEVALSVSSVQVEEL